MESGMEEHTMQSLHEYCQNHQDDRVIYLHMNGSNQASEWQDDWRRHLTQAVVSPECLVRAVNEQCDVCGLLFLAQPSYNFVGNIFNSQCSYIRRLIPPMEYGGRMDNLFDAAKEMFENGTLAFNGPGWALDPSIMGTGQFAPEHWLGSHPSLERVCASGERKNIGRHCLSRLASQKTGISKDSHETHYGVLLQMLNNRTLATLISWNGRKCITCSRVAFLNGTSCMVKYQIHPP